MAPHPSFSPSRAKVWMAAAVITILWTSSARASVFVIGGGLATECSQAALAGASDNRALTVCNEALETESLDRDALAGTLVNRGVMYMRRQNLVAALKDFDRSIQINATLGEAFVNRGAAKIAQGEYDQGLADIDKGLALGPEEPEKAYFNRALAYEGLGDTKRAYFDYLKALEIKPDWEAPKVQLQRFKVTRP